MTRETRGFITEVSRAQAADAIPELNERKASLSVGDKRNSQFVTEVPKAQAADEISELNERKASPSGIRIKLTEEGAGHLRCRRRRRSSSSRVLNVKRRATSPSSLTQPHKQCSPEEGATTLDSPGCNRPLFAAISMRCPLFVSEISNPMGQSRRSRSKADKLHSDGKRTRISHHHPEAPRADS